MRLIIIGICHQTIRQAMSITAVRIFYSLFVRHHDERIAGMQHRMMMMAAPAEPPLCSPPPAQPSSHYATMSGERISEYARPRPGYGWNSLLMSRILPSRNLSNYTLRRHFRTRISISIFLYTNMDLYSKHFHNI